MPSVCVKTILRPDSIQKLLFLTCFDCSATVCDTANSPISFKKLKYNLNFNYNV